jgi:hypothetical protein
VPDEEPVHDPATADHADEHPPLIGCTVTANGVVTVPTLRGDVVAVLKTKPWANLVRDIGWQFPEAYLDHVARLMLGAGLRLYRIDGTPISTDQHFTDEPDRAHTSAVNHDIAQGKANALPPEQAHAAYLEAIKAIQSVTKRPRPPRPSSGDFDPPSSAGLTPRELSAEIQRCIAAGWQPWEIAVRFTDPTTVSADQP